MKKYVLPGLCAVMAGMLLGATAYCGMTFLSCFMDGSPSQHPVAFPMSILSGVGCAVAVVVLGWRYSRLRKRHPSVPMTVADVLLALAVVLPSLMAWGKLAQLLFAQ